MENLFETVLGMSGTASIVILLVLLARLALRKAPKVFSYALWAVVLFRLLCPLTIESAFSLLPTAQVEDVPGLGDAPAQVIQVQTGITTVDQQVNDFFLHHPYQGLPDLPEYAELPPQEPMPAIQQGGDVSDWRTVPAAVWLAGAALLLGYSALSLLRLRRRLVGSVPLAGEENVRLADHIPSPFVLGLLRPKIYLPSDLPEGERDYILLHERTHIRRGDHILRALAWLALAVHWFNPLVWLAFHLAGKDMEMSCDEAVLHRMGRDVRADYSTSLLRLSQGGKLPVGPLAFGGGDPQSRIKNVLSYKKPALWVMAVGLLAVLTACTTLATSRGEKPGASGLNWNDLTADLTFSLEKGEGGRYVRMQGSVGDTALTRGASWHPEAVWGEHPDGELSLVYPAFTDGIEANIRAWWADEERTSVTVSTSMTAMLSSQFNVGWWDFTVELTGGTVTEMAARSMREGYPDGETRMYPESITDEEAVKAARVAAKLLTAAEDFYANARSDSPLGFTPVYTMYEQGRIRVEGEGLGRRAFLEWSPEASLYFAGDPGGLCPVLAGEKAEGGASWADQDRTAVEVVFGVNDERVVSGTICGFRIQFTADLDSGTITEKDFQSMVEGETLELTDEEMTGMARILAALMQGAEDYYESDPPLTPAELLAPTVLGVSYALDETGRGVSITGLDCGGAVWMPVELQINTYLDLPEQGALGYLSMTNPRFLGGYFASAYGNAVVLYYPEEDGPLLAVAFDDYTESVNDPGIIWFTVDLAARKVLGREIIGYAEQAPAPEFSDEKLVDMAGTLAGMIEGAADYYADASNPPPEEGPLPFDQPLRLWFASGAGAWRTALTLHADGSFEGRYDDSDLGVFGEDYPMGTQYTCTFHGRFGDVRQVTDASWSLTLEELTLDTGHPIGEEWIAERTRYISSAPNGLNGKNGPLESGAQFVLYTPEASGEPGGELYGMENESSELNLFWHWWPQRYAISEGAGGTLGCYGLRNVETNDGFFGLSAWGIAPEQPRN